MNWILFLCIVVVSIIQVQSTTSLTIPQVTLEDIYAFEEEGKTDEEVVSIAKYKWKEFQCESF